MRREGSLDDLQKQSCSLELMAIPREGKKPLVSSVSFGGWKKQRAAGGSSAGQWEQTVTEPADTDRVQDSAMLLSTVRLSGVYHTKK